MYFGLFAEFSPHRHLWCSVDDTDDVLCRSSTYSLLCFQSGCFLNKNSAPVLTYFTSLHSRACCVLLNMCGDVNSPWNVLWCWFSGSWNCSPAPLILMQVSLWDQQCHLVLRSGGGRRAQMKKGTILNIFSIRDQQLIWRQYNRNALHQLLRLISVSHLYNLSPN